MRLVIFARRRIIPPTLAAFALLHSTIALLVVTVTNGTEIRRISTAEQVEIARLFRTLVAALLTVTVALALLTPSRAGPGKAKRFPGAPPPVTAPHMSRTVTGTVTGVTDGVGERKKEPTRDSFGHCLAAQRSPGSQTEGKTTK